MARDSNMQQKKGQEPLREAVKRLDERLGRQLEDVWWLAEESTQDAQRSKNVHQQGMSHCRAVEGNLTVLVPDKWKGTRFTATDLLVLSAAAALHDMGKVSDSPGNHDHVSMWEVYSRAMEFGLNEGQAEMVKWVVRAHNDGDLEALPPGWDPSGTTKVGLRPLAALFKLADVLQIDRRRISRQVVKLGGKRADDNPKTCFWLRVQGWHLNDQGRIELHAVPKDWDDVAVIHVGLEMTRRELEPMSPTLQDAGFPWELTLGLDEAGLGSKSKLEVEAERRIGRAFVGMEYFTEEDTAYFKGRDDDAQALWRQVMATPVTLLVGDSGVGKTSLIHAGLFPRLHRARWCTVYTRPFNDPDHFVASDLWHQLLDGEPPADVTIVDALSRASEVVGGQKLLVVLDQFEDVARVSLPEMLHGLQRAFVAVQAGRFCNLRLLVSYRTDAETTLGPLFQRVSGSNRSLPRIYLQPLSRAGGRAALSIGFAEAQVAVDDLLLDTIADQLEVQTTMAGVYPPHVQMVGEILCQAAREENESNLTTALYCTKGGCEEIIGHYLLQRLSEFGEREEAARRVLAALVRSAGVKGQWSLEELRSETKLRTEPLTQLLAGLVEKRMVRRLDSGQHEIVHDHLALLVRETIDVEERQLKRLRESLDLKAKTYVRHHVPLQLVEMAELYGARERISPNDDQMRLLLHSCLLGLGPAWFWLHGVPKARYVPLLQDALVSPMRSLRENAVSIMVQIHGREAIPDLRALLKDEDQKVRQVAGEALAQVLQQTGPEAIPSLRALLEDEDWKVRQAAGKALAQVLQQAGQKAIPDLRALLKDEDWRVHLAAGEALAQVFQQAGPEAIPDLRALLKDQDRVVRQAAGEALAQVAGREAVPDLRALVKDEDGVVRLAAARALAQVAGQEAVPDLRALLKDEDGAVRLAAARALGQMAGREAIPDLRALLRDENWVVQQAAGEALAQVFQQAGPEAVPDLRALLRDGNWGVRQAAGEALAQVFQQAGPEAIPDLRALLKDQDRVVRQAAGEALAQVAGQEAVPDLRALVKDEDGVVRLAAARALAQVSGREAVPDLRALLKDKEGSVRRAAAEALEKLVTQDDLAWLTQWVTSYPLDEVGEMASRLLIYLDRSLYFPG
jgi:HEAT repeat protein